MFKNSRFSFVEPPSDTLLPVSMFHQVPSPSTLDVIKNTVRFSSKEYETIKSLGVSLWLVIDTFRRTSPLISLQKYTVKYIEFSFLWERHLEFILTIFCTCPLKWHLWWQTWLNSYCRLLASPSHILQDLRLYERIFLRIEVKLWTLGWWGRNGCSEENNLQLTKLPPGREPRQ